MALIETSPYIKILSCICKCSHGFFPMDWTVLGYFQQISSEKDFVKGFGQRKKFARRNYKGQRAGKMFSFSKLFFQRKNIFRQRGFKLFPVKKILLPWTKGIFSLCFILCDSLSFSSAKAFLFLNLFYQLFFIGKKLKVVQ